MGSRPAANPQYLIRSIGQFLLSRLSSSLNSSVLLFYTNYPFLPNMPLNLLSFRTMLNTLSVLCLYYPQWRNETEPQQETISSDVTNNISSTALQQGAT
jgi:hypothetical protein